MYYVPFLVTLLYTYFAVKKTQLAVEESSPPSNVLNSVVVNLAITEVIYLFGWFYDPLTCDSPSCSLSFSRIILFYVMQDIYFYFIHRYIFHKWLTDFHAVHHQFIIAYAAWYGHPLEHILLNIGSIIIPFWIFPNPAWVLFIIIIQQIYTSVNGHTPNSPHSVHHNCPTKRFGSIYLVDRLLDTF
jgi:sterol desaturase/sphingolipid hydroxylase (fatty acid hydroxylase superfamily)